MSIKNLFKILFLFIAVLPTYMHPHKKNDRTIKMKIAKEQRKKEYVRATYLLKKERALREERKVLPQECKPPIEIQFPTGTTGRFSRKKFYFMLPVFCAALCAKSVAEAVPSETFENCSSFDGRECALQAYHKDPLLTPLPNEKFLSCFETPLTVAPPITRFYLEKFTLPAGIRLLNKPEYIDEKKGKKFVENLEKIVGVNIGCSNPTFDLPPFILRLTTKAIKDFEIPKATKPYYLAVILCDDFGEEKNATKLIAGKVLSSESSPSDAPTLIDKTAEKPFFLSTIFLNAKILGGSLGIMVHTIRHEVYHINQYLKRGTVEIINRLKYRHFEEEADTESLPDCYTCAQQAVKTRLTESDKYLIQNKAQKILEKMDKTRRCHPHIEVEKGSTREYIIRKMNENEIDL